LKRVVWAVGLVGLILVIWISRDSISISVMLNQYAEFKRLADDQFWWALSLFFLSYFASVSLSLPIASFLTLTGAAVFGWVALPTIVLAATHIWCISGVYSGINRRSGVLFQSCRCGARSSSLGLCQKPDPMASYDALDSIFPLLVSQYFARSALDEVSGLSFCDPDWNPSGDGDLCRCWSRPRYHTHSWR